MRTLVLRALYGIYFIVPSPVRSMLRPLSRVARALFARRESVIVDGLTMYLDTTDPGALLYIARADSYERAERSAFRDVVSSHPGCIVVDLGAQFGIYSLTALATNAPERVIAVEASPRCAAVLAKSLSQVTPTRWSLFTGAIGSTAGETTFWLDQQSSSDNRGFQDGPVRATDIPIKVPVETVDRLIGMQPLSASGDVIVKMDVQGAECLAMRGMAKTIAHARSLWVFLECGREFLESAGSTMHDLAESLQAAAFTHAWRVEKKEGGLTPIDVRTLLDEIRCAPTGVCEDYVFARDSALIVARGSSPFEGSFAPARGVDSVHQS